jgi:2-C-methyl-D-erythritol 4-phosphate cytidylyltransferase
VLVHDAARPLTPVELIDAVAAAVHGGAEAVVPALRVADTVKRVRVDPADPAAGGTVVETVDRSSLRAVQTPQGFRRSLLAAAHLAASDAGTQGEEALNTDDAALVERVGGTVLVIPGQGDAFKVTKPIDVHLAEAVLAQRRTDGFR